MRIIAGAWRGRTLRVPAGDMTRPTADRVRQAVFDSVAHAPWAPGMEGTRVLDACAGTGAMGLEALSRGAAHVTFMERDRGALAVLRANVAACGAGERAAVLAVDATLPPRATVPCGLVFLDPPYGQGLVPRVLHGLRGAGWLGPGCLAVVETAPGDELDRWDAEPPLLDRRHGAARIRVLRISPG